MGIELADHSYGKAGVRLTKVTRLPDRHELRELTAQIALDGDFAVSYTAGDNRQVVATDSMKNTVYVLAKRHDFDSPESFALLLAAHFLATYPQVSKARVEIVEDRWERIDVAGALHPHAFVKCGPDRRGCSVTDDRSKSVVTGRIHGLQVLKTTASAFKDFVRDEFTTLPDAEDRIFATEVEASWEYSRDQLDWNAQFAEVRRRLLSVFAGHFSLAVQQTLYEMGKAVLEACPSIARIRLTMPNQHRLLVNLQPFGLENANEIFVPTSEPFGRIEAQLVRS